MIENDLDYRIRKIVKEEILFYDESQSKKQKPISNTGSSWTPVEDRELADEVRSLLIAIAITHRRSFGAIASRIRRNNLMFMPEEEQ